MQEIDRFIAYKRKLGEYTAHTALTKRNKLLLMVNAVPGGKTAAAISSRDLQVWHDSLIGTLTSTTIHGYLMAARAFFRWAIEVARLRRQIPSMALSL